MPINEGDPVRQVRDVDRHGKGFLGIYRYLPEGHGHAIVYNDKTTFGHNLGGYCDQGFGWWIKNIKDLEPLIKPYDPTQGNEEDDI